MFACVWSEQVLVPFKLQWSVCTPKVRKHPGLKQRTLSFCLWINRQKMYESIVDNKQSLVLSVPRGMLRTGRLFWGRAGSSNHTSGSVYMACSLWCVLMVSRHHVHRSMPADFLQKKRTNQLRHLTLIYDPSTQGLRPLKFIIGGGRSSHWSLLLSLNLLTLKAKDSYICNWIIHQNDWGIKVFFLKNLPLLSFAWTNTTLIMIHECILHISKCSCYLSRTWRSIWMPHMN